MKKATLPLIGMGVLFGGLVALGAAAKKPSNISPEHESLLESFERYELERTGQLSESKNLRELVEAGEWDSVGAALIAFANRTGSFTSEPVRAAYNAFVAANMNLPDIQPGETLAAYTARVARTPPAERR